MPMKKLHDFLEEYALPALVGILLGALLCGCATEEAKLKRWFEQKNEQLEQQGPL